VKRLKLEKGNTLASGTTSRAVPTRLTSTGGADWDLGRSGPVLNPGAANLILGAGQMAGSGSFCRTGSHGKNMVAPTEAGARPELSELPNGPARFLKTGKRSLHIAGGLPCFGRKGGGFADLFCGRENQLLYSLCRSAKNGDVSFRPPRTARASMPCEGIAPRMLVAVGGHGTCQNGILWAVTPFGRWTPNRFPRCDAVWCEADRRTKNVTPHAVEQSRVLRPAIGWGLFGK